MNFFNKTPFEFAHECRVGDDENRFCEAQRQTGVSYLNKFIAILRDCYVFAQLFALLT